MNKVMGSANAIKTKWVTETTQKNIDEVINYALENELKNKVIIDIQFGNSSNADIWNSALIIYREV